MRIAALAIFMLLLSGCDEPMKKEDFAKESQYCIEHGLKYDYGQNSEFGQPTRVWCIPKNSAYGFSQ